MTREIFVDAAAWLALAHSRDAFHQAAVDTFAAVLRRGDYQVTTNLVAAEAYILIRQRISHVAGMRFLETLHSSKQIIKVCSDVDTEAVAEAILRRHADQDFSFTDAVSFAVMRQRNIAEAFSFDHHFLTAGFALVPIIENR